MTALSAFQTDSGRSAPHPTQSLGAAPMNDRFGETVPLVRTAAIDGIQTDARIERSPLTMP